MPEPDPTPGLSGTTLNAVVAGGISTVNSIIPFLILVGVLHWTADAVAAAYLVVSNIGTFVGLMIALAKASNT